MLTVGRWLVHESGGPQSAIPRLTRRLHKLDPGALQPLLAVPGDISADLTPPRQRDALDEIARAMRLG